MAKNKKLTLYKHYFNIEEKKVEIIDCGPNYDRVHLPISMIGVLLVENEKKCRYVMYLTEKNPSLYMETLIQKQQSKLKGYEDKVQVERDYLNVLKMVSADYSYRNGEECQKGGASE